MHRRNRPTRGPRRGRDRTEFGLPDLGRWVRQVRDHRKLTRPEAAGLLHISSELLKKIEYGTVPCTQPVLEQMITTYGLNMAQATHTRDLARPSAPLMPVEELRTCSSARGHRSTLKGLDERGVVGAYLDPLWNIVYANERTRTELPGIDDYDGNLALWFFHPGTTAQTAEPLVVHWDTVAAYLVASLRAAFGIHRDTTQAQILHRTLCGAETFKRLWADSIAVAYGYKTEQPLQLRDRRSGEPYSARIHLGSKSRVNHGSPDLRFCIAYRDPCDPSTDT